MKMLDFVHPSNLLIGAAVVVRNLALKAHVPAISTLAGDVLNWAKQCRDLFREIVCDAGDGQDMVKRIAADGKITPAEAAELIERFNEIEREAQTGKIE